MAIVAIWYRKSVDARIFAIVGQDGREETPRLLVGAHIIVFIDLIAKAWIGEQVHGIVKNKSLLSHHSASPSAAQSSVWINFLQNRNF